MNPLLAGVWGALVALAYWPGLSSALWAPRAGLIVIGLGLVGIWPSRLSLLTWLIWLTLAGAGASLLWTPDLLTGLGDLGWLVVLALVMSLAWTTVSLEGLIAGTIAGLAVSSVLVIWQIFGLGPVAQIAPPSGLMFNRDWLAELAAPLALWCVLRRQWSGLLVAGVPLALCTSRVAWLAFGLGLGVSWAWGRVGKIAILTGLVCLAGLALPFLLGHERMLSALLRLEGWKIGLLVLSWQGLGLGFWHTQIPFGHLVHSDILGLMDEIGLMLAPLGLAAGLVVWGSWRNSYDGPCRALSALLACLATEACLSFPLHNPSWGLLAAAAAGTAGRSWWMVDLGERDSREIHRQSEWPRRAGVGGEGGRQTAV